MILTENLAETGREAEQIVRCVRTGAVVPRAEAGLIHAEEERGPGRGADRAVRERGGTKGDRENDHASRTDIAGARGDLRVMGTRRQGG